MVEAQHQEQCHHQERNLVAKDEQVDLGSSLIHLMTVDYLPGGIRVLELAPRVLHSVVLVELHEKKINYFHFKFHKREFHQHSSVKI